MKLVRRVVILAKAEAAYGVDATPGGADAIMCNSGVELDPSAETIERDVLRDTLSPAGTVVGAKTVKFTASVELKGGGLTGQVVQAPEYEPLLLACGMRRVPITELALSAIPVGLAVGSTVTDDTSSATGVVAYIRGLMVGLSDVVGAFAINNKVNENAATITANPTVVIGYLPLSDPAQVASATVLFYRDGILHKVLGCRGTFEITANSGKIGTIKFALEGLWADPEDQAPATPQYVPLAPPVCTGMGLTVGVYTPVGVSSLTLSLGAEVAKRVDLNSAEGITGLVIKSRKPSGSLDPEAASLATFDPWAAWKNATKAAVHARIGADVGNSIEILVPKAQYSEVKYGSRDDILTYSLKFSCTAGSDAGDDELLLIYR